MRSTLLLAAGRGLDDLPLSSEFRRHLAEVILQPPKEGEILHREDTLEKNLRVLKVTAVPLSPGVSGVARICVLAEDVTSRKQMDAEIAQTRKLRAVGELVGGIAHEFNNLLTPVMACSKAGEIQMDGRPE